MTTIEFKYQDSDCGFNLFNEKARECWKEYREAMTAIEDFWAFDISDDEFDSYSNEEHLKISDEWLENLGFRFTRLRETGHEMGGNVTVIEKIGQWKLTLGSKGESKLVEMGGVFDNLLIAKLEIF